MNFNIKEIRRALLIIAIGFLFMTSATFVSLANIQVLQAAEVVKYATYPGITLIICGTGLMFSEHYYFKLSFIVNIILGAILVGLLALVEIYELKLVDENLYIVLSKILNTLLNFCILLGNNLVIQGLKAYFTKRKYAGMVRLCTAIGYIIDILILCSTVLSLIDFPKDFKDIGVILVVVFDFLAQAIIAIFYFVSRQKLRRYL